MVNARNSGFIQLSPGLVLPAGICLALETLTSTIKKSQMQGIMQDFRVISSGSKLGQEFPVVAFRYGGRVRLEDLMVFIPDTNRERQKVQGIMMKSRLSLDAAKEKYPDWYDRRVVRHERRGRWIVKRDLYGWWPRCIGNGIRVGHRFYGIMTLAISAEKCGIEEDELRRDAFSLLRLYDEMSEEEINRFTQDDIVYAIEMFNEDYVTFPKDDIAKLSGLTTPVNKRNARKQADHLKRCRIIQQSIDAVDGTNWRDGNGRKEKRGIIFKYMRAHPEVKKKTEIARALQIDRGTMAKYYDEILAEFAVDILA